MTQKVTIYVLIERIDAMKEALELQAKEYERRLDLLNGEARKLHDMQQSYIPREVFDRMVTSLESKIQINTDYKKEQDGKTKLTQWVPWIIAALALVYSYFKK